jgi:hypothetical protein
MSVNNLQTPGHDTTYHDITGYDTAGLQDLTAPCGASEVCRT